MDEVSTPVPTDCVYSRLDDAVNEIRLLKILSSSTESDIICELTSHVLDDVEDKYTAISYTWGDPEPTKQITVNGLPFQVRYNCWFALKQMRYHDRVDTFFWIDAICIDQDCHQEKNIQVGQMGKIYSKALQVAACIGQPGTDSAFFQATSSCSNHQLSQWSMGKVQLALEFFVTRPYFKRVWTVQECIVAKHTELYVAGQHFPLREVPTIDALGQFPCFKPQTVEALRFMDLYQDACRPDASLVKKDLAEIIFQYRHRVCYDPRDKIYGFLALVRTPLVERLQVNYEKPLMRVLFDFLSVYDVFSDVYAASPRIRSDADAAKSAVPHQEVNHAHMEMVLFSLRGLIEAFLGHEQFNSELSSLDSSNTTMRSESCIWASSLPATTIQLLQPRPRAHERGGISYISYARVQNLEDKDDAQSSKKASTPEHSSNPGDRPTFQQVSIGGSIMFWVPSSTRPDDLVFRFGSDYSEISFVCRRRFGAGSAYEVLGPAQRLKDIRFGGGNKGFNHVDFTDPRVNIRIHPIVLVALALQDLVDQGKVTAAVNLHPNWLALNEIYLPEDVVRASSTTDQPLITLSSVEQDFTA